MPEHTHGTFVYIAKLSPLVLSSYDPFDILSAQRLAEKWRQAIAHNSPAPPQLKPRLSLKA